jgi:hypothetical protein
MGGVLCCGTSNSEFSLTVDEITYQLHNYPTSRSLRAPSYTRHAAMARVELVERDFAALHNRLADVFDQSYSVCYFLLQALTAWAGGYMEVLDELVIEYPHSPLPLLLRGMFMATWAWDARGQRHTSEVARDTQEIFHRRLEYAWLDLSSAYDVCPAHPCILSPLLRVMNGRATPIPIQLTYFNQSKATLFFPLWSTMMVNLTWRWGGTHKQMFALAREATSLAPPRHSLHSLISLAHAECRHAYSLDTTESDGESKARKYYHDIHIRREILEAYHKFSDVKLSEGRGCDAETADSDAEEEAEEESPDIDRARVIFAFNLYVLWKQPSKYGGGVVSLAEAAKREMSRSCLPIDRMPFQIGYMSGVSVSTMFQMFCTDLKYQDVVCVE